MNRIKRLVGSCLVALMALPPASAWAACTQADMAGLWHIYTTAASSSSLSWAHCRVRINNNGAASSPGCFLSIGGGSVPLSNGRIRIERPDFCVFVGSFRIGATTQTVRHITMASDKRTAKGVGTSAAGAFTVDMLKLQ